MKSTFLFRAATGALALAALLLSSLASGVTPAQALTCAIAPDDISIGITYHGAKIKVSGESKTGDELLVKITAPPADAHLRYLGKAAGMVWMKLGSMEFKHVPNVYLLYSTKPVDQLLAKDTQAGNLIGFEAIKARSEVTSSAGQIDTNQWFAEFIKFKESEKLYRVQEGTIQKQAGPSSDTYQLETDWPYQAAPGNYEVEVLAVRNGQVVDHAATTLKVEQIGFVAQISNLAFHNSAVYGIMAIVVAMLAGFGVAALFKGGGGAH